MFHVWSWRGWDAAAAGRWGLAGWRGLVIERSTRLSVRCASSACLVASRVFRASLAPETAHPQRGLGGALPPTAAGITARPPRCRRPQGTAVAQHRHYWVLPGPACCLPICTSHRLHGSASALHPSSLLPPLCPVAGCSITHLDLVRGGRCTCHPLVPAPAATRAILLAKSNAKKERAGGCRCWGSVGEQPGCLCGRQGGQSTMGPPCQGGCQGHVRNKRMRLHQALIAQLVRARL